MKPIIRLSTKNWQYLLTLFLGCLLACTMGAFGPIYMNSLNRLGFESELTRISGDTIDITIFDRGFQLHLLGLIKQMT